MEIEVVKKEKNDLTLRIEGETHTLMNLLCSELYADDSVKVASYTLEHPLTRVVLFHLKTAGKSPEKALSSATDRIVEKLEELKKEFQTKLKRRE